LNRAVDGDIVAIELLPEEQWVGASELVLEDDPDGDQTDSLARPPKEPVEVKPTGKVVAIVRRKWRQYCGIIQPNLVPGVS